MAIELQLLKDTEKWDEFIRDSPQGNVFCTTSFIKALGKEYDLVALMEGSSLLIGAVVIKENGLPIFAPHPYTMYQGVLFPGKHSSMPYHKRAKRELELLEIFLPILADLYQQLSFCLHYAFTDIRGFQWFHYHEPQLGKFRIDIGYTGLIDLAMFDSFDSYYANIRRSRKREYNQAVSIKMTVEESSDYDMLDRLNALTFERQGENRHNSHLIKILAKRAISDGFGRMTICRDSNGVAASALLFIYDSKCAYALIGGNDPAYRDSGSSTFLLLEAINWCKLKEYSCVDLVGLNSPNRGDFKVSLNVRPVPYYILTWQKIKGN